MQTDQFPTQTEPIAVFPTSPSGEPSAGEPESPYWQLFLGFGTWLASVAALLLVPLVFLVPYMFYRALTAGGLRPETLMSDKTFILLSLAGVIPAHAVSLLVAWAVVTSWGKRPFWKTIRWSWPENFPKWKSALFCVLLALGLLLLSVLITKMLGGSETQLDQIIKSSYAARIMTALLATATAPFVEELIYRGVLYPAVERTLGMVWAVMIVSLLFAGVHVVQYAKNPGVIAAITMLSVCLTLVRALSGRLLPCFLIHLVFNGVQSIIIVLSPNFDSPPTSTKASAAVFYLVDFVARQIG